MRLAAGLVRHADGITRCWWPGDDLLYLRYHDEEWGTPVTDDRRLFEKICLEGFQAGLSWLTILRKRPHFREAFADFDIDRVARFGARDIARLLEDRGIVRHRGKIESTINNARRAAALRDEFGSLAAYFWRWEPDPRSRPRRKGPPGRFDAGQDLAGFGIVGHPVDPGAREHQVGSGGLGHVAGEALDHAGRILQPVPPRHLDHQRDGRRV